jgi:hypothetical protein
MIEATGRIDIDGRGRCDYLGDFAGLAFLNRISERCSELLDRDPKNGIFSNLFAPQARAPPDLGMGLLPLGPTRTDLLPSKGTARLLTNVALQDACCLMRFVHQPSFDKSLDRIYDVPPETYTPQDEAFLPLLYLTLALGQLYSRQPAGETVSTNEINNMKGLVLIAPIFDNQLTLKLITGRYSFGQEHPLLRSWIAMIFPRYKPFFA